MAMIAKKYTSVKKSLWYTRTNKQVMNPQNTKIQNAIFWIEVDKIVPNPYQPRREFDEDRLRELSDSIRQYGILQPLVVSRKEELLENGSVSVRYELIAGERRLRASRLAGLSQVPVVVRIGDDNREMLELAIIENLQREDLNAVERAQSFQRLADEFKLTWTDVGKKVGKSREYVSNTVRILMLPQDILDALSKGLITEGHTRPLLMLIDRPAEQITLFKEMLIRKMTVREAEKIARTIAFEKIRKKSLFMTPEVVDTEEKLAEALGTRVQIEPREKGGKILIEYFSHDEFLALSLLLKQAGTQKNHKGMFDTIREENLENLKANATEYMPRKEREPFTSLSSVTPALIPALIPALTQTLMQIVAPEVVIPKLSAEMISTTVDVENIVPLISSDTTTSALIVPDIASQMSLDSEVEMKEIVESQTTVQMSHAQVEIISEAIPTTLSTEIFEGLPEVLVPELFTVTTVPITEEQAFSTNKEEVAQMTLNQVVSHPGLDDRSRQEVKNDEQEEDLYNIKNFSL